MPERLKYAHLFERNPFEGKNPTETFSLLHWGNRSKRVIDIDAPEPLVMLGMMAKLCMQDRELRFSKGEAFLAVGQNSNELYIIPRVANAPMKVIPSFSPRGVKRVGPVLATHYLSTKGGSEEHYYYHDHESPFPILYLHKSGIGYIRASNHNGKPSYAVGKEGIVG
jgi:hypothetical protein